MHAKKRMLLCITIGIKNNIAGTLNILQTGIGQVRKKRECAKHLNNNGKRIHSCRQHV